MSRVQSYLSSGSGVNLALVNDQVRHEILEAIGETAGRTEKALVVQEAIVPLLTLVVNFPALQERAVRNIYPLNSPQLPADSPPVIVYIVQPKPSIMAMIATQIKNHAQAGIEKEYYIFYVPRRGIVCEKELARLGVRGDIHQIGELSMNIVPLDSDLLSMELPNCFPECVLRRDYSTLYNLALGLMQLQVIFGIIPRIVGKGDLSARVAHILMKLRKEQTQPNLVNPEFDSVVILDRSVDLITPLCTQHTYEGLIDEVFGIHKNSVELPERVHPPAPNGKLMKVELNSGDTLFGEIRDMHFARVGELLNHKAKGLSAEYDERHEAKTVSEIHKFTSKLQRMKDEQNLLRRHIEIATDIDRITKTKYFLSALETENQFVCGSDTDKPNEYIEDCICRKDDPVKVLRLICLQSLINNGFSKKVLDFYRREFLQTYGHDHLITLMNLEKAGLFKAQEDKKNIYSHLKKSLKLLVDEQIGSPTPEDISYVYSGYAPLSVRVIQQLLRSHVQGALDETLKLLPGQQFEYTQDLPDGLKPKGRDPTSPQKQPVTLVVFVGGCTFAEVSALRFLSQHVEGRDFVIATTKMISGRTLIETLSL